MRRHWIGSSILLMSVVGIGAGLAIWKYTTIQAAIAAAANRPEPMESVTAAQAQPHEYQPTTISIGTIVALRSITLQNELAGTVKEERLTPGKVVDAGALLIALDVSVEQAELKAQQAQAVLTQSTLKRMQNLWHKGAIAREELDQAQAQHDIAVAQIDQIKAVIARKTIRAPFKARIGIADVHTGQYLDAGTVLTTLQGIDKAVYVDFDVTQLIATALHVDDKVEVINPGATTPVAARIIAIDARVDPATRNAKVRAIMENAADLPIPGTSVRVRVPVGTASMTVAVPASVLRRGPSGDHVFVLEQERDGRYRAHVRQVISGPLLGDLILIRSGLKAGELVAATGSFKLNEGSLVVIQGSQEPGSE